MTTFKNNTMDNNQALGQQPTDNSTTINLLDLNNYIAELENKFQTNALDKNTVTLYNKNKMRVVLLGLRKDAELKKHTANGAITVQVLEGKMNFTTDQTVTLQKGQMIVVPDKVPHSVVALEKTYFLLTLLEK